MKLVFENPHVQLFDITEKVPHTVFAYWKGFLMHGENQAKIACQKSLDYFLENKILVMISDHRFLEGASLEFLDWIHDYYFPTAAKNGLIAEIVLDATELMGTISLELMYDAVDINRSMEGKKILTPKVDTLENAEKLALEIVQKYKMV
jgi:hypothetical protein